MLLGRLLLALGRALVSRVVLRRALDLAHHAAVLFAENDQRRAWVIKS